jgi:hypothetical protein
MQSHSHAKEKKDEEWWQREVDKKTNSTRQEESESLTHAQIYSLTLVS